MPTALGAVGLETLADELDALGSDPIAGLRKRRQQLSTESERRREGRRSETASDTICRRAYSASSARRRKRRLKARDAALTAFPEGVDAAVASRTCRTRCRDDREE